MFFKAELAPGKRLFRKTVRDAVAKIEPGTLEDAGHQVGVFVYWTGREGREEWCKGEEYPGNGEEEQEVVEAEEEQGGQVQ